MDRLNNMLQCMSSDGQGALLLVTVAAFIGVMYLLCIYIIGPIISLISDKLPKRKRDQKKIEAGQKWREKWLWKPLFCIILTVIAVLLLFLIWFLLTGIYEAAKCFIEVG